MFSIIPDLDHYSRSEHSLKGVFSHLMEKVTNSSISVLCDANYSQ